MAHGTISANQALVFLELDRIRVPLKEGLVVDKEAFILAIQQAEPHVLQKSIGIYLLCTSTVYPNTFASSSCQNRRSTKERKSTAASHGIFQGQWPTVISSSCREWRQVLDKGTFYRKWYSSIHFGYASICWIKYYTFVYCMVQGQFKICSQWSNLQASRQHGWLAQLVSQHTLQWWLLWHTVFIQQTPFPCFPCIDLLNNQYQ